MQRSKMTSVCIVGTILFASSSPALEKRAVPAIDRADEWNSGTLCHASYYNICTGWVWVWTGFADGDRIGTKFEGCDQTGALLAETMMFVATSSPQGYGFTGTIAAHNVDANDCPVGPAIASQPYLPTSLIDSTIWPMTLVPAEYALVVTIAGEANPAAFGTDHPAIGPTGPQACGTCFPANRVNHSFFYGTAESPTCPGTSFNDGICDAQLFWDALMIYTPLGVAPSSWGSIKGLYK